MPSFHDVGDRDLWAMAQYVSSLGDPVRAAVKAAPADSIARGAKVYKARCASCHGETGEVPAAMMNLRPAPKDLRTRVYDTDYLLGVVRSGIPGTAMVPVGGLTPEEEKDLVAFVTSMFREKIDDR